MSTKVQYSVGYLDQFPEILGNLSEGQKEKQTQKHTMYSISSESKSPCRR